VAIDVLHGDFDTGCGVGGASVPTITVWLTNTRATAWFGLADTEATAGTEATAEICFCLTLTRQPRGSPHRWSARCRSFEVTGQQFTRRPRSLSTVSGCHYCRRRYNG
jgi:hypothetical protein